MMVFARGLQVQRRAKAIYQQLSAADSRKAFNDALAVMGLGESVCVGS